MRQDNNQQLNTVEGNQPQATEQAKKKRIRRFWDVVLWLIIVALVLALVIRLFVYTTIQIDGESMTSSYYNEPTSPFYNPDMTYHHEQFVHVLKLAYPKRGDVVVFYENDVDNQLKTLFTDKNKKLIKRVVALKGDKLWIEEVEDGSTRLVIQTADGDILYENYYKRSGKLLDEAAFILSAGDKSKWGNLEGCTEDEPFVVSEDHFFAMGDNRTNSHDSRSFGEVSYERLFGVVWER